MSLFKQYNLQHLATFLTLLETGTVGGTPTPPVVIFASLTNNDGEFLNDNSNRFLINNGLEGVGVATLANNDNQSLINNDGKFLVSNDEEMELVTNNNSAYLKNNNGEFLIDNS